MEFCQNRVELYTYYIVDYLEPWFDTERFNGNLKEGTKSVIIDDSTYAYEGEIDKEGRACGFGTAYRSVNGITYKGTFVND